MEEVQRLELVDFETWTAATISKAETLQKTGKLEFDRI